MFNANLTDCRWNNPSLWSGVCHDPQEGEGVQQDLGFVSMRHAPLRRRLEPRDRPDQGRCPPENEAQQDAPCAPGGQIKNETDARRRSRQQRQGHIGTQCGSMRLAGDNSRSLAVENFRIAQFEPVPVRCCLHPSRIATPRSPHLPVRLAQRRASAGTDRPPRRVLTSAVCAPAPGPAFPSRSHWHFFVHVL